MNHLFTANLEFIKLYFNYFHLADFSSFILVVQS